MSNSIPTQVSKSTIRRNPHLYGSLESQLAATLRTALPGVRVTTKNRRSLDERMNKTERRFFALLKARGHHDAAPWRIRLVLANGVTYVPDFYVPRTLGRQTFFETKGAFQRDKGEIKLRMAASQFPEFRFVKAVWAKGAWTEAEIPI